MSKFTYDIPIGDEVFHIEAGHVALQANASLMLHYDEVVLLCCATMSKKPREGIDFFPLMCDYEEKMYASGKFPGGFMKREGRPSERATLTSRMIDRPIRPRFPEGMRNEVQLVVTALSADCEHTADVAAVNGASLALHISDIPYDKPIAAVRVGIIEGEYVINPTHSKLKESPLDLFVAGTADRINMIEDESDEVRESVLIEAIAIAHEEIKAILVHFEKIREEIGKEKFVFEVPADELADFRAKLREYALPKIKEVIPTDGKVDLFHKIDALVEEALEHFAEEATDGEEPLPVKKEMKKLIKEYARKVTLEERVRVDGRRPEDVREIEADVHFLPRTHGSAMFKRGQTQVISCVTLGTLADQQKIDVMDNEGSKRYVHHYNFPPYSVGEVRFMRGPGRRDIGHGILAEKALVRMIPDAEEYPYSIRVVSEVIESNASSSMASVCGSTLALLDAGVPIKTMVAGVSIGLITDGDEWVLLRDLSGYEDFNGDMDFKIAGTDRGVNAIQLDVKIEGVTLEMIEATFEEARLGRLQILEDMRKVLDGPREASELSAYIPVLELVKVDQTKIGMVIGPSGKTIKKLSADFDVQVDINDEGLVYILGTNRGAVSEAAETVRAMTLEIKEGMEFEGKVVRITDFGAFLELTPGTDGLLHISQIADRRIDRVDDVLKLGDKVPVCVNRIDDAGKIDLVRTDIEVSRDRRPPRQGDGGRRGRGERDRDRGGQVRGRGWDKR